MSDISNIGVFDPTLVPVPPTQEQSRKESESQEMLESSRSESDTIELSDRGIALAKAANDSTLRIARIAAIRAEIEADSYETPARIYGTVDRLLDIII